MKIKKKIRKPNLPKTRKELRKEKRLLKKQHRREYYTNRNKPGKFVLRPKTDDEDEQSTQNLKAKRGKKAKKQENVKAPTDDATKFVEKEKRQQMKLQKEMQQQRNKQLLQANVQEDRHIKQLEKQLKLSKRKSITNSFAAEGLDYLLELCDPENMKNVVTTEQVEEDDDFKEDFELMSGNKSKSKPQPEDENNESDFEESDSDEHSISDDELSISDDELDVSMSDEEDLEYTKEQDELGKKKRKADLNVKKEVKKHKSDSEDSDDSCLSSAANSENDEQVGDDQEKEDETWEDIYGRTRSKDGSVIKMDQDKKYIPPGMRDKSELSSTEKFLRLKRQLKGLLNRLAEANMHNISSQIETLYMNNSRNDMNSILIALMMESLASNVLTPERLMLEHISLVTILHANIGMEIGANFLQTLVKKFDELFNLGQETENKILDNLISLIAQLYNFKVFHSQLLYQILTKLSDKFDEKSLDCILLILRNVGFSLRKDDPLALKSLISRLQKQAASASEDMRDNPRVKFMLDVLLAIKNNNVSKIPNYDVSYSEHLKKLLKSFVRKGNYVTQLNISLTDLLKADERGKWWIVGSAWTGKATNDMQHIKEAPQVSEYSQNLLELARKQRMNTDTRCNIFCIIMSAEDYLDAFEKILHLGLKNQQEREIVHVILHCCLQEKSFNPYYAVLAQKFCEYDRKYQMTIKYSVWDKLKMLTDCPPSQISNLAKFLTHLFIEKGLPITVLKTMRFAELDKVTLRFIRQIMLGILLHEDAEACVGVFDKLSQSDKLKMFRESLRLFVHHFVLRNLSEKIVSDDQKNLLQSRADLVEKMLTVNDKKTKF